MPCLGRSYCATKCPGLWPGFFGFDFCSIIKKTQNMPIGIFILTAVFIFIAIIEIFVFLKNRSIKNDLTKREEDAKYKTYEIAILNELSDKMGYSLGIQNVIELIIKSLPGLIDYSVASYMLPLPEKIIFRAYCNKPAYRKFIGNVKAKMLDSMSGLLKTDLKNIKIEETLWGPVSDSGLEGAVGSFFSIPLMMSGKFEGLLAIADSRVGFYKEKEKATLNKIAQGAVKALARLQEVVESENSKLNAMVSSMTDGVIMTDMYYRILVANPAAKKAIGLENKNDLSTSDFISGLGGKIDLKDKIEESVRLDKIFVSDEVSLNNNFFRIIVAPVKDRWKSLGSVIIFQDITREKEVQQIKDDFTSMIVHELRSPLDSIKKITALMRSSEVKKAKRVECFQMIYTSSSDMLELINNLLNVAKIEAGKFELRKQQADIKKIIESRISFFDITAKDAKLKLASCFGKNIPENVGFDPNTISQVLNNLISNAIKFTKEGGSVTVQAILHKKGESIEKEAKEFGINWLIKTHSTSFGIAQDKNSGQADISSIPDSLLVAVTDNGAGIAPDQIDKLFNKFVQAKNTFVEKGGTGLGLAITKSIVESHGGVVGVESIEGKGATFYFTLPIN